MTGRDQNARNRRGEAIGLGVSLLLHTAVGLLFFGLATGIEAARPVPVTIVLTGMSSAAEPPPRPEARTPLPKKTDKRAGAVAKAMDPQPPQSVSEAPVEPVASLPVAAPMPEQVQVAAPSAPPQRETAAVATGEQSPAGAGGLPAGGGGMDDGSRNPGDRGFSSMVETGKAAYLQEHFFYIRERIMQHLAYPSLARRMGWRGQITVSFVIGETGRVENLRIIKSSGFKVLDDNALRTIEQIQPFPKPPIRAEIVIPIEYRLG